MPYHQLVVYQKAYQLALKLHRVSLTFPKVEQYGLAQQVRASSKSIAANIAEGMGKQDSPADVKRFIRIAIGSCDETRVWIEFAKDLSYIEVHEQVQFDEAYQEVGRMLQGIVKRYSRLATDKR